MKKMGNKRVLLSVLALVAAGFLLSSGGSSAGDNPAMSYMLIFQSNDLPENVGQQIALANGQMTAGIKQIGVAVASSSDPKFIDKASKIRGIQSVVLNPVVEWGGPEPTIEEMDGSVPDPIVDPYFDLEWNLFMIHAAPGYDASGAWTPGAWDLGAWGEGTRVFVLDSGIDSHNPDISPNLNTSLCRSFVPDEDWEASKLFNHGTHVAGIIAAAQNNFGVIGVAPKAELVAVKVLSENTGIGLLSYLNEAIVYAADNGADIINMSLGGYLPRRNGWWVGDIHVTAKMVGEMLHATQRAITYAYQKGATMVAAAGNSALDADHDKNAVLIPAQLTHVIAVSATDMWDGPWYLNNYGKTLVSFAAPGDWVLSDINDNKFAYWSGTSQAAAHVSGVAALIIGQNGGSLHPAQVESVLKQSADDLGKPGNDDYYGMGRVNAYKAVLYSR
jgi:subtilisin family serine protease